MDKVGKLDMTTQDSLNSGTDLLSYDLLASLCVEDTNQETTSAADQESVFGPVLVNHEDAQDENGRDTELSLSGMDSSFVIVPPPVCNNTDVNEMVDPFMKNNGTIVEVCDAIEERTGNFCPNREEIIEELEQIANTMECVENRTFVVKTAGAVMSVGAAVVGGVAGGLLIAGTGGAAATVILPAVALGISVPGGVASVAGPIINSAHKKKQFKKVEKLTEKDKEFYKFVRDKLEQLKLLIEANEHYVFTIGQRVEEFAKKIWTKDQSETETKSFIEQLKELANVQRVKKWADNTWESVKNRVEDLRKKLPGFNFQAIVSSIEGVFRVTKAVLLKAAPLIEEALENSGRLMFVGGKLVGSLTLGFNIAAAAFDIYNLASGISSLVQKKDVKTVRAIADSLRKLCILEQGHYTMGDSTFYAISDEENEKDKWKEKAIVPIQK